MKKSIKAALSIAVILFALWFITKHFQKTGEPQILTKKIILVDPQSNKMFLWTMPATQEFEYPIPSPFTQRETAYPAYKCLECGAVFGIEGYIPHDLPVCPVCGSNKTAIPEMPSGQESTDIAGPIKIVKTR